MAEPVLQVQDVSIAFGGLRALSNVGFAVPRGSLTALIGPNGAGKTTLFALISGFLRPDRGRVVFEGRDITGQAPHLNARAGMTRTFQIVQPFALQTVRENIAVGVHLHVAGRGAALAEAERVAARVGLAGQLDKPAAATEGCGFSIGKIPGGRAFETEEAEALLRNKKVGPLEGFRSKAGWPFTAELRLVFDDEIGNWKLEFDFGDDAKKEGESGAPVDFSGQQSLGACPKCQGHVYEHGTSYVCEHSVGSRVTCDFKSGKIILQQPVPREQMTKLLAEGKTALLENFVSNRTRRKFKAFLAYDKKEGKVGFEFEPRPARGAKPAAKAPAAKKATAGKAA